MKPILAAFVGAFLFLSMGFQPIQYIRNVTTLPSTCITSQSPPVAYQGYIYNCVAGTYQQAGPGSSVNVAVTATSGGTTTLDLSSGDVRTVTMPAGNTTIAFSNIPTGRLTIFIIQDSVGSRLVTWPASIKWANGTTPTLSVAASAVDKFEFVCNGTNCYPSSAVFSLQ